MKRLDTVCGTQDLLAVTRGKKHEHIRVTMDFDVEDSVALAQHDYVKKLWNDVPTNMKKKHHNTPESEDTHKLDRDSPLLNAEKKDECHTITARSIWISQRSRPGM